MLRKEMLGVGIAGVICFGATALAGELGGGGVGLEESHTLPSNWQSGGLSFGQTLEAAWEVPLFDTMGDSRQLEAIRLDIVMFRLSFGAVLAPNETEGSVHDSVNWAYSWRANDSDGASMFPFEGEDEIGLGGNGMTSVRNAGFDGETQPPLGLDAETASLLSYEFSDPWQLDVLTGSGTLELTSQLTLTDAFHWDATFIFPYAQYVPGFLTINPDELRADFELTYIYSEVPAPGMLPVIGVVAAGTAVRRRRGQARPSVA